MMVVRAADGHSPCRASLLCCGRIRGFRRVQARAWEPITGIEMEALESLGLAGGVGGDAKMMSRGVVVLLGLLRMGQDGGGII